MRDAAKIISLFFFGSTGSPMGFPGGSDGKESVCSAGDLGSIPGLGRSPGGRTDDPHQYSGMEKSMDTGCLEDCSPWCNSQT